MTALPAAMTSPANNSALGNTGTTTFTWTTGNSVTHYTLNTGSTAGASDLYSQSTTNTTLTASGLPTNGETIYVTLVSTIEGQPYSNSYTYMAGP